MPLNESQRQNLQRDLRQAFADDQIQLRIAVTVVDHEGDCDYYFTNNALTYGINSTQYNLDVSNTHTLIEIVAYPDATNFTVTYNFLDILSKVFTSFIQTAVSELSNRLSWGQPDPAQSRFLIVTNAHRFIVESSLPIAVLREFLKAICNDIGLSLVEEQKKAIANLSTWFQYYGTLLGNISYEQLDNQVNVVMNEVEHRISPKQLHHMVIKSTADRDEPTIYLPCRLGVEVHVSVFKFEEGQAQLQAHSISGLTTQKIQAWNRSLQSSYCEFAAFLREQFKYVWNDASDSFVVMAAGLKVGSGPSFFYAETEFSSRLIYRIPFGSWVSDQASPEQLLVSPIEGHGDSFLVYRETALPISSDQLDQLCLRKGHRGGQHIVTPVTFTPEGGLVVNYFDKQHRVAKIPLFPCLSRQTRYTSSSHGLYQICADELAGLQAQLSVAWQGRLPTTRFSPDDTSDHNANRLFIDLKTKGYVLDGGHPMSTTP